jgi:molybdopterin-guanine dinucleotide biosynthesis protein
MNAGKTETAAHIVRGLSLAGYRVGAAKLTGTGAGGDVWSLTDAGASMVLDFTDAGFSSTYLAQLADLEEILAVLTSQLYGAGMDCVVLE